MTLEEFYNSKKHLLKKWWFWVVLIVILAKACGTNETEKQSIDTTGPVVINSTKEIESAINEHAKVESIKESCSKLSKLFGEHSSLTGIQKEDMWDKKYNGKKFNWSLQLIKADTSFDGSVDAVFVCLPPEEHPVLVSMTYPKELKEKLLKFRKDTPYKISGTLIKYQMPPSELSDQVSIRITAEPSVEEERK